MGDLSSLSLEQLVLNGSALEIKSDHRRAWLSVDDDYQIAFKELVLHHNNVFRTTGLLFAPRTNQAHKPAEPCPKVVEEALDADSDDDKVQVPETFATKEKLEEAGKLHFDGLRTSRM